MRYGSALLPKHGHIYDKADKSTVNVTTAAKKTRNMTKQ